MNTVRTRDYRFMSFLPAKEFRFLDILKTSSTSYDVAVQLNYTEFGEHGETNRYTVLYMKEFMLSRRKIIHTRKVDNLLLVLSKFGGFFGIVFKPIGLLAEFINFNFLFAKISRALYFV